MLQVLFELAKKGDKRTLRGLLIGVKDNEQANRFWAFEGLAQLAVKGDARVLSGLLAGTKDSFTNNWMMALEGLRVLAKKGNAKTKEVLKKVEK
jgi:hypothetical protein